MYRIGTNSVNDSGRSDYYPFGSVMQGRVYSSGAYRYGFNGKEKEAEWNENYAFEYRIHDARLGRFLSVDPLTDKFPYNSSYCFAENKVIRFIELEGLEIADPEQFKTARLMLDQLKASVIASGDNSTKIKGLTKTQVIEQLTIRLNTIQSTFTITKANNLGYYCATVADLNVAALYNPIGYATMVYNLFSEGSTACPGSDRISIEIPDYLKQIDMSSGNYNGINAIDAVMTMSLRSSENDGKNKGDNLTTGSQRARGTLPWEQNDQLARLGLGIKDQSYYHGQRNRDLKKLAQAVSDGYVPLILDDETIATGSRAAKEKTDIPGVGALNVGIHNIQVMSMTLDKKSRMVTYTIISHGKQFNHVLSYKDFKKGMKGYWIPKNNKNTGGGS